MAFVEVAFYTITYACVVQCLCWLNAYRKAGRFKFLTSSEKSPVSYALTHTELLHIMKLFSQLYLAAMYQWWLSKPESLRSSFPPLPVLPLAPLRAAWKLLQSHVPTCICHHDCTQIGQCPRANLELKKRETVVSFQIHTSPLPANKLLWTNWSGCR